MNKACPVVLRKRNEGFELLSFIHPLAGKQIVKGSIEAGEDLKKACERELFEESGLQLNAATYIGKWTANFQNQIWGFYIMETKEELKNNWSFFTKDGGGHNSDFFWLPLNKKLNSDCYPLFKGAISYISKALTISCTGQPKADTIFAKNAKIPPAFGCR